jgi:hypothetical protein
MELASVMFLKYLLKKRCLIKVIMAMYGRPFVYHLDHFIRAGQATALSP